MKKETQLIWNENKPDNYPKIKDRTYKQFLISGYKVEEGKQKHIVNISHFDRTRGWLYNGDIVIQWWAEIPLPIL